jgi:hypothetical protein
MKVKDLKEQLTSMPDNADVMMFVDKMLPVSVVQYGTIEDLKSTGKTLFGMEVVGGEKRPVIFLCDKEVCTSTPYDFENPLNSIDGV